MPPNVAVTRGRGTRISAVAAALAAAGWTVFNYDHAEPPPSSTLRMPPSAPRTPLDAFTTREN